MTEENNSENVVSFADARLKKEEKKLEERRRKERMAANPTAKRSRDKKIADALAKHGSDEGRAIKDRFKDKKVDLFEKKEEKDDGSVSS